MMDESSSPTVRNETTDAIDPREESSEMDPHPQGEFSGSTVYRTKVV